MNESVEKLSDAASIRIAIQAYARQLRETLGTYVGVITQSADPMSRSAYQEATLQQYDPQEHRDWSAQSRAGNGGGRIGPQISGAPNVIPPLREENLLAEWRKEEYRKPLLIVAPAGSGKSCLLESMALQMANDLLDDGLWRPTDHWPTGVPFLISMSKMVDAPLNEYLQEAEEATTAREPTLSRFLLNELRKHGRLVLLIDGFDEVPSAQGALGRSLKRWEGGFALTTRPGYGERRIVADITRQRTLQELTENQANAYVCAYFVERQCVGTPTERIVKLFERAWATHFGRLLRRPLYLKAWCDFVSEENGKKSPASLGELAGLMFHRLLEARHVLNALPPADKHAAISTFIDWFGRLALLCDEDGFEADPETLARKALIGDDAPKLTLAGTPFSFEQVATRCGLLIYTGNHTFQIPKVPLAEYAIGKYLGRDAFLHPSCPQTLIKTFQKWIWRPDRHEILDYAFDALWNPPDGGESPWANALLCWAKTVQKSHAAYDRSGTLVQDDFARPFALAVARWRLLNATASADALADDAVEVAHALYWFIAGGHGADDLTGVLTAPAYFITAVMEELLWQHEQARGNEESQAEWLAAIRLAVTFGRAGGVAKELVFQLLKAYERDGGNQREKDAWIETLQETVTHVNEDDGATFVDRFIDYHNQASDEGLTRAKWIGAIVAAAGRVPARVAADLIVEWKNRSAQLNTNRSAQFAYDNAIQAGASRIPADIAVDLVNHWIGQAAGSETESDLVPAWAIEAAAARIPEESAPEVIHNLLLLYDQYEGNIRTQRACLTAISGVASRVIDETAAKQLVARLITICHQAGEQQDTTHLWVLLALVSVAARIGEEDAPDLAQFWEEYHNEEWPLVYGVYWIQAIGAAASRVPEELAEGLIIQLVKQYEADDAETIDWCLELAMAAAARRCPASSAASIVRRIIAILHESADLFTETVSAPYAALCDIAGRVDPEASIDLVLQWLNLRDQAQGDDNALRLWGWAIKGAARQIRSEDDQSSCNAALLHVCDALFVNWFDKVGLAVVANNPSIGVIAEIEDQTAREGTTSTGWKWRAVLRRDQRLDPELVVAPPLVMAAFIEKDLTFLENSLANSGEQVIAANANEQMTTVARLRSGVARLNASEGFAERCRVFETRLAAIDSRLESRPVSSHSGKSAVSDEPTPSPFQQASQSLKVHSEVARPHKAIVDYRGDPRVLVVLQTFYEIGYELYPAHEKSLNRIGQRFEERSQGKGGLRPLPKDIGFPVGAKSPRPFMTDCAKEARQLFGKHFRGSGQFGDLVDEQGEALLFKKVHGIYRGFTELGWRAWEICRDDLLFHQLITESDLPLDEQSR